jgi:hypothetical protein
MILATPEVAVLAPLDQPFVVLPWHDPAVDRIGFDPRSRYLELYWLSILGPTTTLLMRRIADGFDTFPDGFELDVEGTAVSLGLQMAGPRRHAFPKALERCVLFGLARGHAHGLVVRRRVPPISQRHLARLPESLRDAHAAWVEPADQLDEAGAARARTLARAMLDAGDDQEVTERQLLASGVTPAAAVDAVRWALGEALAVRIPA